MPGPTRTSSVFAVVADAIVIQPWLWRAWAGHRTKPCGFAHVDYSWPHASRLGLRGCQAVQPPMRTSKTPSSALVLSPPLPRYHPWRVDAHTNERCRHLGSHERRLPDSENHSFLASFPDGRSGSALSPPPYPAPTPGLPPPPLPPSRGERAVVTASAVPPLSQFPRLLTRCLRLWLLIHQCYPQCHSLSTSCPGR